MTISKFTIGAVVLAALAVLLAATAAGQSPKATARGGDYSGFTQPSLQITVGSRAEGLVAEVLVEEGQAVGKGQVILRLDSTVERLEVELSRLQAESSKTLEAAQLVEKQKAAEVSRARTLLEKGGITGTEYEQRELELKVARINIEIAQANLKALKLQYKRDLARLAQREIKAPADGIVTRIHKDPGEAVERLEKVAELVQLDPLEIVLNLPVATRGTYAAGGKARVQIAGQDRWHETVVKSVNPVVDFASNTYRLKLRLPNPDGKIQSGLRVTVDLGR